MTSSNVSRERQPIRLQTPLVGATQPGEDIQFPLILADSCRGLQMVPWLAVVLGCYKAALRTSSCFPKSHPKKMRLALRHHPGMKADNCLSPRGHHLFCNTHSLQTLSSYYGEKLPSFSPNSWDLLWVRRLQRRRGLVPAFFCPVCDSGSLPDGFPPPQQQGGGKRLSQETRLRRDDWT